jgi:hypothetical protein
MLSPYRICATPEAGARAETRLEKLVIMMAWLAILAGLTIYNRWTMREEARAASSPAVVVPRGPVVLSPIVEDEPHALLHHGPLFGAAPGRVRCRGRH